MRIGGFNKLTTQDFPGNLACIIFTNGCNFDCDYCYNRNLVESNAAEIKEDMMKNNETFNLSFKRSANFKFRSINSGNISFILEFKITIFFFLRK